MNDSKFLGSCILAAAFIVAAAIFYRPHVDPVEQVGRYQFQPSTPPGVIWVIDTATGEVKAK